MSNINIHLGQTYKMLRKLKNIEAKTIAGPQLSYSQLLKFEQGKTSLTVEKFIYALDAIQTNLEEFQYEFFVQSGKDKELNIQAWEAYWERNAARLEIVLEKLERQLELEPENQTIFIYKLSAESALSQLKPNYQPKSSDVQKLTSYLLSIKQWSYTECDILMNCAPIFTDKQMRDLIHQMLNPQINVRNSFGLQGKIDGALLACTRILIKNKHFSPLREIFDYLEEHVLPDYNMYERAMFAYFKALFRFRKTTNHENLAAVEMCISAFKVLDCFGLANMASEELAEYKRESHI